MDEGKSIIERDPTSTSMVGPVEASSGYPVGVVNRGCGGSCGDVSDIGL